MMKFFVLLAVFGVAVSAPAPGFLHGAIALPAATSYASRVDVHHSTPIIKTIAAPIVTKTIVSPLAYSVHTPVLSGYGLGHGYGLSHGYGLGHSYGLDHSYGFGHSYGLGHGYGW